VIAPPVRKGTRAVSARHLLLSMRVTAQVADAGALVVVVVAA
jgi:hypothetical protein